MRTEGLSSKGIGEGRKVFIVAFGVAVVVAVMQRIANAFLYPMFWGFDSSANWDYIKLLTHSWALPAPDAAWATAHPPLFYYVGAALTRPLIGSDEGMAMLALRLVTIGLGFLMVWLIARCVRQYAGDDSTRPFIAAALVLFMPCHIYMSAMVGEEIWASTLITLALVLAATDLSANERGLARPALIGMAGGLAALAKLTGVLVVVACVGAYGLRAIRLRRAEPAAISMGIKQAAIIALVAGLVGGWFYARNLIEYGYLYPHDLPIHAKMHTMPPGEREVSDFLRLPVATFRDPNAMNPDLLRSIWGTTYASWWFDAHRHFLPRNNRTVNHAGTLILTLALLPTFAFGVGCLRGLRRAIGSPHGPDSLFLTMIVISLAGYAHFVWQNPQFAVLKGSYLMGLSLPFAYYASEVLSGWTRSGRAQSLLVWALLIVLFVSVTVVFYLGNGLWNLIDSEFPGMRWIPIQKLKM